MLISAYKINLFIKKIYIYYIYKNSKKEIRHFPWSFVLFFTSANGYILTRMTAYILTRMTFRTPSTTSTMLMVSAIVDGAVARRRFGDSEKRKRLIAAIQNTTWNETSAVGSLNGGEKC